MQSNGISNLKVIRCQVLNKIIYNLYYIRYEKGGFVLWKVTDVVTTNSN